MRSLWEKYAQERINLAKEAAQKLDIPYAFFEAPHYGFSDNQLKVAEQNFDIITKIIQVTTVIPPTPMAPQSSISDWSIIYKVAHKLPLVSLTIKEREALSSF